MKNNKKFFAIVLTIAMAIGLFSVSAAASAASYGTDYWNHTEPSGSDYAYWNGKKMVKHKGTSTDNVKWMQSSMNYLIKVGYISANYIVVDGSFGPASKSLTIVTQRKLGITQDGSFGPNTISKVKKTLQSKPWENVSKPTTTQADLIWPLVNGKGSVSHVAGEWRGNRRHVGTDIGATEGTAIIAVASGKVVAVSEKCDSDRGYYITIRHGKYITVYQHMKKKAVVKKGSYVSQGQTIGYVGQTGRSKGSHLHFEIVIESTLSKKSDLTNCLYSDVNNRHLKPTYYSVSKGSKVGNYLNLNLKQV